MDSVIFEDSPLTSILEGQGDSSPKDELSPSTDGSSTSLISFAPRGRPSIRKRLRNVLPRPLKIETRHRPLGLERVKEAVTSSASNKAECGNFLDQFRFILVGSQLLSEHAKSTHHRKASSQWTAESGTSSHPDLQVSFSLQGTLLAAAIPFIVVWALKCIRWQMWPYSLGGTDWKGLTIPFLALTSVSLYLYVYARHKLRQALCLCALEETARMINAAQSFDAVSSAAFTLVAEVEVVSKGYDFGDQLPPISRLDVPDVARHSMHLRRNLASSVSDVMTKWANIHQLLKPLTNEQDLEQYYDIYDVSRNDLDESAAGILMREPSDEWSLKHLRFELARLFVIRKIVLCDLLALSSDPRPSFHSTWRCIVEEVGAITMALEKSSEHLTKMVEKEEGEHWGSSSPTQAVGSLSGDCTPPAPSTPGKDHVRMQLRRLNSMSQGIRGLHTKTILLREEASGSLSSAGESAEMASLLARQYDRIGTELRGLLGEWERGKSSMLLNVEPTTRRASIGPGELRAPISPTYSLGGRTVVEGSPPEALRLLNGEMPNKSAAEKNAFDEEVFEAVALPPRQRCSMTREEKMARMKEDRLKRATLQEKADANTHMLRELETVIKHRPQQRPTARVTSM